MIEPPQLLAARERLAKAEAGYRSEDGLFQLEEGLGLLDEIITERKGRHRTLARNLATTYATRICKGIAALLDGDRAVLEPELEHLFKVVLAFDQVDFDMPAEARPIKIRIAKRLIDRYYEGHSPEEKRKALQKLANIADGEDS